MKKSITILQIIMLSLILNSTHAQEIFTGVWRAGTGGYYLYKGLDWGEFSEKWSDLGSKNYRLVNIKTYMVGSQRQFAGIWVSGTDGYMLTPAALDWTAFSKFWDDNSKKGQRRINVETYMNDGKLCFMGVFRAGNDGYMLTPLGLEWTAFSDFWDENSKKGQRLINIESYMYNGKRCYLGVFRAGSGGYVLTPYGKDWNQFKLYWAEQARNGQRLVDIESFVENGKRIFLGVFRQGSDSHYLWGGVDWESFTSKWKENGGNGLRLMDLETYGIGCDIACMNNLVMEDDPKFAGRETYPYPILAGPQHCTGLPGSCPTPATGATVTYSWPVFPSGTDFYAKNSVLFDANDQIFTLPFKAPSSEMSRNGWLYKSGSWHHALDYTRSGYKTFEVCAAAPGRVIYIGWDNWSGNTMIISHNAGGQTDVYRTIYMHLQNGPDNDCDEAWTKTIADANITSADKTNYKTYLNGTGCPLDKTKRDPTSANWGTDSKKIDMSLLGKNVTAGQVIAWAGSTGPGGCGCKNDGSTNANTHLHIFFAHRDPVDNNWYLVDPYGIYSYPSCYPTAVDGEISTSCARYPILWKGGNPKYAQ